MTTAAKPWERYSERQRWVLLGVLFLIATSSYVDKNIIGVLLQPIKEEFKVSDTMLGLLSGLSFAVFYATLGLPVARLADRGDRRFIITLSLALWSVMTAFCGLAQSFWQLAAARIGVGAGEAGAIPPGQSLIADYFPPERRGKALGGFMMASMAGYVIGTVLGGQLAQAYGWRTAFLVVGLPGVLLAVIARLVLDEPRLHAGITVAPTESESLRDSYRALVAKPSFVGILIAMVLYFLIAYGAFAFIVPLMIRTYGITVGKAGALFGMLSTIGAVAGNAIGGGLTDRLCQRDPSWAARFPAWGMIGAFFVYEAAFLMPNLTALVVVLTIGGVFLTGPVPSMFAALHLVCGSKRRATSVAIIFFFANLLGLGLGPIIAGGLSDTFARSVGPADGLRYAMMVVMVTFLPCGYYLLRAARTLKADMEA